MANMGYCRFRNALGDLRDCRRNLGAPLKEDSREFEARQALVDLCAEILAAWGYDTSDDRGDIAVWQLGANDVAEYVAGEDEGAR